MKLTDQDTYTLQVYPHGESVSQSRSLAIENSDLGRTSPQDDACRLECAAIRITSQLFVFIEHFVTSVKDVFSQRNGYVSRLAKVIRMLEIAFAVRIDLQHVGVLIS